VTTLAGNMDATQAYIPQTDVSAGFYTLDSELIRVGLDRVTARTSRGGGQIEATGTVVDRGVGGTTAAAHSSGVTFTAVQDPSTGGGSGGVTVLEDPGNVWQQNTAVSEGYRIAETIQDELRVFEVAAAGMTHASASGFTDFTVNLAPLGITNDAPPVTWRYLGIVGQFDFTVVPFQPESLVVDAKGSLGVSSLATPDDGDPLLTVRAAEEVYGLPVLEINSDGQSDFHFQDGSVGGPISFDFWSTDANRIIVSIRSDGLRVNDVNGDGVVLVDAENDTISLSGLPTADPLIAGQLYTDGAPSAGVPKPLMVSGG